MKTDETSLLNRFYNERIKSFGDPEFDELEETDKHFFANSASYAFYKLHLAIQDVKDDINSKINPYATPKNILILLLLAIIIIVSGIIFS